MIGEEERKIRQVRRDCKFLVAIGAFFLLRNTFDIDWAVVWPVVVIAFGVVVLVAAFRPRAG